MIERNICVRKGNTKYLGIPCQKICLKGSFKKNLWSNKRFFRIKIQIQSQGKAFKNCSITASIFSFYQTLPQSLQITFDDDYIMYHKVCWINHVGVIKVDEKRKENLKNNRLREEKVIRSLWRVFRRFKIFSPKNDWVRGFGTSLLRFQMHLQISIGSSSVSCSPMRRWKEKKKREIKI